MSTFARGKAFEQIVAGMIRHKLDKAAKRDTRSGANWHRRSDIATDLPLHLELKDHATLKPKEWFRSADAAASIGQTPVVVFRSDEEVMAMLRFDDMLNLFVEIADLKAELTDLRKPLHVAKTVEEVSEQIQRVAGAYTETTCREGHKADEYGRCLIKGCKYSRGYIAPRAKKEVKK